MGIVHMSNRRSLFRPVDLAPALMPRTAHEWNPAARTLLDALPRHKLDSWGIPLNLGDRWVIARNTLIRIPIGGRANYVVVAHMCDSSAPTEPSDRQPGQILEVGEVLAEYVLRYRDGATHRQPIRRRFEVGEFAVWWGELAFAARPHRGDSILAQRSPFGPSEFGFARTGLSQGVYEIPTQAPPHSSWWVYALENPRPQAIIEALEVHPTGAAALAIGAMTLAHTEAHPLRHGTMQLIRLPGNGSRRPSEVSVDVDLGVVGRIVRLQPVDEQGWLGAEPGTWRASPTPELADWPDANTRIDLRDRPAMGLAAEVSATVDASVVIDGLRRPLRDLEVIGGVKIRARLRVVDSESGRPMAARVHIRTMEGRTLAPLGHDPSVNSFWFQDESPDLHQGDQDFAYVDGSFQIDAEPGPVLVEATRGLEWEPTRLKVMVELGREIDIPMRRAFVRGEEWMTADTHVHFLSPHTALLEAEAEDVDLVNLLAAQWGYLQTNVGELGHGEALRRGNRSVWMGTENRQHLLGHILLLGTGQQPILPMAAGGPMEATIGATADVSLADWAREARRQDGLAIIPHFPNPYAEAVADVILGLVDAIELRSLGPHRDSTDLVAWYHLLNVGYRVPCVAGTDKMWAGRALGAVRTYALIARGRPGFKAFAAAVRAGRTFATNGPLIDLRVAGREPGSTIILPASGGSLDVEASLRSTVRPDRVEIVVNGRVAADGAPEAPVRETLRITESGWIAARAYGVARALSSSWRGTVAAHTSPIYVIVGGRIATDDRARKHLQSILEGGLLWLDTLATRPDEVRRQAMRRVFVDALSRLQDRAPT
jgi:hypothetical protein